MDDISCKKKYVYFQNDILLLIADYFVLVLFAFHLYLRFIETTMLDINLPENIYYNSRIILWWVVGIKFVLYAKNRMIKNTELILALIILTISIVCYNTISDYDLVLDMAVIAIGMLGIDYKKIIRIYLYVSTIITIVTIIQSKIGVTVNLIYFRNGHIRNSFGFVYPTDFAAHIFYILCAYILIRNIKCTYFELLLIFFIAFLLQIYCQARCSFGSIILLVFWCFYMKNKEKRFFFFRKKYQFNYNLLYVVVPLLLSSLMIVLGRIKTNNSFILLLDKLLSGRIRLTREAFSNYSIKLWGQYVYMNGNGGKLETPVNYFFIDCSYINILLRYGLFVFLMVMLCISILIMKNRNNSFAIGIILIICLHSVIEHHLFEFFYNFFAIMPLADFNNKINKKNKSKYNVYTI